MTIATKKYNSGILLADRRRFKTGDRKIVRNEVSSKE